MSSSQEERQTSQPRHISEVARRQLHLRGCTPACGRVKPDSDLHRHSQEVLCPTSAFWAPISIPIHKNAIIHVATQQPVNFISGHSDNTTQRWITGQHRVANKQRHGGGYLERKMTLHYLRSTTPFQGITQTARRSTLSCYVHSGVLLHFGRKQET